MKFTGVPTHGKGRGKTLGFPTINLRALSEKNIKDGVYAARVTIRGKEYISAMHCGAVITFGETEKTVELFLLDTPEIAVSATEKITVETISYLRPVIKFASKEELIVQITKDVEKTRRLAKKPRP